MAVDVEDLACYCRIDLPEPGDSAREAEIETLNCLRLAAEEYLTEAGCAGKSSALYDLALKRLVLHWYENRNAIAYNRTMVPMGLREIINQLKMGAIVRGS